MVQRSKVVNVRYEFTEKEWHELLRTGLSEKEIRQGLSVEGLAWAMNRIEMYQKAKVLSQKEPRQIVKAHGHQ